MSVPAHPRSRGENSATGLDGVDQSGSSPLTRGKQSVKGKVMGPHRLIPAHAGKTNAVSAPAWIAAAHPRSRGENGRSAAADFHTNWLIPAHAGKTNARPDPGRRGPGSSPLTRGKPSAATTPTPAPLAHPRSRGENDGNGSIRALSAGSSPLTRGKRVEALCEGVRGRLIPAHAGKT